MTEGNTYTRSGVIVEDLTEPMKVEVKPRDVKAAVPGDDHNCAIACALKRQPGVMEVSVGAYFVYIQVEEKQWLRGVLKAQDRLGTNAFDQTGYLRPGIYIIDPPPPSRRIGARAGEKNGSEVRTGKRRTVFNTPPLRHVSRPF